MVFIKLSKSPLFRTVYDFFIKTDNLNLYHSCFYSVTINSFVLIDCLFKVKARFSANKRKMEEKKKEYDIDQRMDELREEEERAKEYRKEKKKVTLIYILASYLVRCGQ